MQSWRDSEAESMVAYVCSGQNVLDKNKQKELEQTKKKHLRPQHTTRVSSVSKNVTDSR